MDIRDTVAVVTGAGVGSGLAIAERLLGAEFAALPAAERAAARPPIPLPRLCDAVVGLIEDE